MRAIILGFAALVLAAPCFGESSMHWNGGAEQGTRGRGGGGQVGGDGFLMQGSAMAGGTSGMVFERGSGQGSVAWYGYVADDKSEHKEQPSRTQAPADWSMEVSNVAQPAAARPAPLVKAPAADPALAPAQNHAQAMDRVADACEKEAASLCAKVPGLKILDCLLDNRKSAASGCQGALTAAEPFLGVKLEAKKD